MLILRRYAYRGVELVVIPQPDGSVACIPEWMTSSSRRRHFKLSAEPRFSPGDIAVPARRDRCAFRISPVRLDDGERRPWR